MAVPDPRPVRRPHETGKRINGGFNRVSLGWEAVLPCPGEQWHALHDFRDSCNVSLRTVRGRTQRISHAIGNQEWRILHGYKRLDASVTADGLSAAGFCRKVVRKIDCAKRNRQTDSNLSTSGKLSSPKFLQAWFLK